uniref:Signal recognition particle 9 kDa protein n=1 Tax=Aplanochytrium stocchinoi TaxID=215587 RepID=A0A6S8A899_9STRA|mmetsp:Transcript_11399/g.14206  ORF Transcript_11399/g.14206 Transcript_11399/m.14206 type:complete len:112 (-) Transcript_11399:630-965(-)
MYIDRWDEFSYRAKELFVSQPEKVRYTFKYRHVDSSLVLKVTDNRVCLKYKTDKLADVNKMDKLNTWFFEQSTNTSPTLEAQMDVAEDSNNATQTKSNDQKEGKGRRRKAK